MTESSQQPEAPPDEGFFPPADLISKDLRSFLEEKLATGEPITVDIQRQQFTGRLVRVKLNEGWIAVEHVDGRRRAFIIIRGGTIRTQAGDEVTLPTVTGK